MAQGAALGCGLLGPQLVLDNTTSPRQGNGLFPPCLPHRKPKDYPTTARACFKTKIFLKIKQRDGLFNII
ncbi:MAG: hypothetical protein EGR49_01200 [Prevotella sp.]|nr:hypothetical protein [Prevotella sp.]